LAPDFHATVRTHTVRSPGTVLAVGSGANRLPFASLYFLQLPFVSFLISLYFPLFPFYFHDSSLINGLRGEIRKTEARRKMGIRQGRETPASPRQANRRQRGTPHASATTRRRPAHDLPKP
jgi:hypothetical protein